jgi:hypothetical protein
VTEIKATARIIADVKPEVKEKLKALSDDFGHSMTQILSSLIEGEYKKVYGK